MHGVLRLRGRRMEHATCCWLVAGAPTSSTAPSMCGGCRCASPQPLDRPRGRVQRLPAVPSTVSLWASAATLHCASPQMQAQGRHSIMLMHGVRLRLCILCAAVTSQPASAASDAESRASCCELYPRAVLAVRQGACAAHDADGWRDDRGR